MSLLLALQAAGVSGVLAVTEQNDSFSATGDIRVTGTFAASEASDTFAATGDVRVSGSLATTESSDVFAATGDIRVTGVLSALESDDVFIATGDIRTFGFLNAFEQSDTFAATGDIRVSGSINITEDNDTFSAAGSTGEVTGLLDASEDSDTFSATGSIDDQQVKSHTWWQSNYEVWESDRKKLAQLNAQLVRELAKEQPKPPEPEPFLTPLEPVELSPKRGPPVAKKKVATVKEAVDRVLYRPDFTIIMELQYEISIIEMRLRVYEIQRNEDADLEAFAMFLLSAVD